MSERGDTLPGLLLACVLMIVVLGASLNVLDGVTRVASDGTRRTDAQEQARAAVDRITSALRNLASPTSAQPQTIDAAGPTSLVFKTVDPVGPNNGANTANVHRVRYCLSADATLLEQTQTWTTAGVPPVPAGTGCPAAGWAQTRTLAANLRNGSEPTFVYDATGSTEITAVHVELLVDTDVERPPGATRLASGVFLRNQNRRPVAAFTVTKAPGRVTLNGSASSDPDGQALTYTWLEGATVVGQGITFSLPVASGSPRSISLRVVDPAGLTADSAPQAVGG